jgi:putative ABC transport system permease protein
VELTARAGSTTFTLLGLDVLRAAPATPSLVGGWVGGPAFGSQASPFDERALAFSAAAMSALRVTAGQEVAVVAAGRTASFTVSGALPGVGEDQKIGVIDIAAAQWRFGQLGRLQRIDLRLAPGADRAGVEAAIARVLPADAQIVTARSEARRSDSLSRAYRVNLEMLSMVALLTGGFLVYSAQALSVTLRRPQFALVRVLGLPRRGLFTQLFVEGAILGVVGAALGIALGLALAALALRVMCFALGGGQLAV